MTDRRTQGALTVVDEMLRGALERLSLDELRALARRDGDRALVVELRAPDTGERHRLRVDTPSSDNERASAIAAVRAAWTIAFGGVAESRRRFPIRAALQASIDARSAA